MDNETKIVTRYGARELSREHLDPILDSRICRVVGNPEWLMTSGFYDKPFLVLNSKQGVHHRFRNPYDALRQTLRIRDWEGLSPDQVPDGEKQRLLALLAGHQYLRLLLADQQVKDAEFEAACGALAFDMGKPRDEVKQQVLGLTLLAATAEDNEATEALGEAMELDRQRLQSVEAVGESLNWRAAIIAGVIIEQQELMAELSRQFNRLLRTHQDLTDRYQDREQHYRAIAGIIPTLAQAKDRPFRSLARRDESDLKICLSRMTNDRFAESEQYLRRVVIAHQLVHLQRDLQVNLYRLTLAQGTRGARQRAIYDRAYSQLTELRNKIIPADAALLCNNPLWRIKGLVSDALLIWRSPTRDWSEIKTLLQQATAAFGA